MRITVANAYESSIRNLQKRQEEVSDAQTRLTAGKRVVDASDDPVAAARAERALAAMVRSEANQRALDASRNVMQQAESTLGDAGDLLQRARELSLQAGNGSQGASDRAALATEIKGIRDQLLSLANRDDGAGGYLFGGQGTDSPPFVDTPAGVVWRGNTGQAAVASDEPLPLSLDGQRAWLEADDGKGGTVSVFTALDKLVAGLGATGADGAAVRASVAAGVDDIDAALGNVLAVRAVAGEALNRADRVESRIAETRLAAKTERSNAEDLDLVEAISDMTTKQTGYDAALKTYSMVQKLSLFQYISA